MTSDATLSGTKAELFCTTKSESNSWFMKSCVSMVWNLYIGAASIFFLLLLLSISIWKVLQKKIIDRYHLHFWHSSLGWKEETLGDHSVPFVAS